MDDDRILELTGKIEETLGKENNAMISDTIGEILTGNAANMKQIADLRSEIDKLKDRNDKLVTANGSLLQRIPMEYKAVEKKQKEETPTKISLKDAFDEKGNFRH